MKMSTQRCLSVRRVLFSGAICALLALSACAPRPIGLIYTNIRLPLTKDLDHTRVSSRQPDSGRVFEVKEPFSGVGIYARVNSNALGDIAIHNGMRTLYFADQQIFSILGVYKVNKTILYGE
jgi:hypothetical protein